MIAGSREDAETATAFFEDMKWHGLNGPLLVISGGAPGIIKAIEFALCTRPAGGAWRIACATWRPRCQSTFGRSSRCARGWPIRRRAEGLRASSRPASSPIMAVSSIRNIGLRLASEQKPR